MEVTGDDWKQKNDPLGGDFHHSLKHVFTHFDMMINVFEIDADHLDLSEGTRFISSDKIHIFAFAKAVLKIFDRLGFT